MILLFTIIREPSGTRFVKTLSSNFTGPTEVFFYGVTLSVTVTKIAEM